MEKEQKVILIRIIISAVVLGLAFVPTFSTFLKLILCLVGYFVIGKDVLLCAFKNVLHGKVFDENFLMSIATIGAFIIGEYQEAVAVMLFYQVGELFQDMATCKSRESIAALMDIRPDYANVEENGKLKKVNPNSVLVGSIIVVKPGEKIPLDGVVVNGGSSLNTAALTGESAPRYVKEGDSVISGCINMSGLLKIQTTGSFKDSTVSKIFELVEKSDSSKSISERFITKFAKIYTPIIVISAVLLFVIPSVITREFFLWLNRALVFLVVSCPCALVLSVPLSFFGGIGGASKHGILIKGSDFLEKLAKVKTVVFDKTGTLTKGNFSVSVIHPEIISKEELLEIAAIAESYSDHPISLSLQKAHRKEIDKTRAAGVENFSGYGIKAQVDGRLIYAGNNKLMDKIGAKWKDCGHSGTVVHVSVGNEYAGHIVISDEIKPGSKSAVSKLKSTGINKTVMLTGDYQKVGEKVAKELNLDEVYTELLPSDKVAKLKSLLKNQKRGGMLAFVGDGINDAPVLKAADVGIAMGALGSDAAIEAADVILMDDNPEKISQAIEISQKTLRIVKQNIVFALIVKSLVLVLGSFGAANLWGAVFADVGVSLLAIINALRAMRV